MSAPTAFPAFFVWEIAGHLDDAIFVSVGLRRPLRPTDPHSAIGVWAETWDPGDSAIGQPMPVVGAYVLRVQHLVKHIDEVEGHELHSMQSKTVRRMLYEDQALKLRLAAQADVQGDWTERFQRLNVTRQTFMADEISGQFLFLSELEIRIETENV